MMMMMMMTSVTCAGKSRTPSRHKDRDRDGKAHHHHHKHFSILSLIPNVVEVGGGGRAESLEQLAVINIIFGHSPPRKLGQRAILLDDDDDYDDCYAAADGDDDDADVEYDVLFKLLINFNQP